MNTKKFISKFITVITSLLFAFFISSESKAQLNNPNSLSKEIQINHVLVKQLGPEHLANAAYRMDADGKGYIASWGDRIVEWEMKPGAEMREVYPKVEGELYSNGGTVMDVDGDGADELIVARSLSPDHRQPTLHWYDEKPEQQTWIAHKLIHIDGGSFTDPHDIQPFYFQNADGRKMKGVIFNIARKQLHLLLIPENPEKEWPHVLIGNFDTQVQQSGMQIADMNQDGHPDIVSGQFWIECPQDPRQGRWTFHRFCEWKGNGFEGMTKHAVADLNQDGTDEIILTEAEIPDARLAIYQRQPNSPQKLWNEQIIDHTLYCPHSLVIADVNADHLPDIIVGEMTAGGWDFPLQKNPKIYVYLNEGNLKFNKQILIEGWGVHEMKKILHPQYPLTILYAADEIQLFKFPNMNTHVSYWVITPLKK